MPTLPPPPPAEVRQAPQPRQDKTAENYGQAQSQPAAKREKVREIPFKPLSGGRILERHARWPKTPKQKHTNRLHKRKQAKQRAKRNGR